MRERLYHVVIVNVTSGRIAGSDWVKALSPVAARRAAAARFSWFNDRAHNAQAFEAPDWVRA